MIRLKEQNGFLMISSAISSLIITLIKFYQLFISPLLGVNCRFYPTCSAYSIEAFKKYGFLKGFILSSKRIFSCHPFGPYGYKPLAESEIPLVKKYLQKRYNMRENFTFIKIFQKVFQNIMRMTLSQQCI